MPDNKPDVPLEILQWINDYCPQRFLVYNEPLKANDKFLVGALAMYHKMMQEIDLIKATDPRLDKEQERLERVWDEFIKNWQPKQINSHLGMTLHKKFFEFINEAYDYRKALEEFISMHETGLLPNRFTYEDAKKVIEKYKPSI